MAMFRLPAKIWIFCISKFYPNAILKSLDSKKTLKSNLIQTTYRGGLRCNSNHIFSDASQSGNAQMDVKTVDRNAGNIHTVFKWYVQRFQHFLYLFGEWDFPPFFLNPFWKLCNILVNLQYTSTKATHADGFVWTHKSYLITDDCLKRKKNLICVQSEWT